MRSPLLIMVAACSVAALVHANPLFQFVEPTGPHGVGLKVVEQFDHSRPYGYTTDELGKPVDQPSRPLQTLIWYPAERSDGTRMTVGDYASLSLIEVSFDKPALTASAKDRIASMQPTLENPLWAVRDAPQVPNRFPVLVYAPSFSNTSSENADLCEYLASHGYVVIATPSIGSSTRDMTIDLAGIDAQVRDISFLIGYAQTLPNVDSSKVAVLGYSWGGIANLFAAARDKRIDALIALDGSLRYYPGLVKEAGDVHPEQMTIPLLYFSQAGFTLEDYSHFVTVEAHRNGPNVLNNWLRGDLIMVQMLGMLHASYSSMYQRNEKAWKGLSEQIARYGSQQDVRESSIQGYGWMARYTVAFLNAYLKEDSTAMAYLKKAPVENGIPQHAMWASYRAGSGIPVSFESFRRQIGREGFDHATDIYAAFQKQDPHFVLEESAMNAWADELINSRNIAEAIALLRLNVQINPDSETALVNLKKVYGESKERSSASERGRSTKENNRAYASTRGKERRLHN